MTSSLNTPISSLLTNKRRIGALKSLGMVTIGDALTYYPFRVTEPLPLRAIREAKLGQSMAFAARVVNQRVLPMHGRRGFRLEVLVGDDDFAASRQVAPSVARLVFFSYKKPFIDWTAGRLHTGAEVVIAGDPSEFKGQLQFPHPQILTIAPEEPLTDDGPTGERFDANSCQEALRKVCRPRPVYRASSRISSEHIHESILSFLQALQGGVGLADEGADSASGAGVAGAVRAAGATGEAAVPSADDEAGPAPGAAAVSAVASGQTGAKGLASSGGVATGEPGENLSASLLRPAIPDILPEVVRESEGLMTRAEAYLAIHDPQSTAVFHRAIVTLRYEEAFVSQTSVLEARREAEKEASYVCSDPSLTKSFIDSLPFSLTTGQQEVIDEIGLDMGRTYPMHRLLQGEVGSGKTVVALAAMLRAVAAGYQAVLVAPTQVLAEQHEQTIAGMVKGLDPEPPVTLLTGGMKLSARRKALAQAASGEPGIVVATHAAFSKTFQAPNLALVVIDEQHRFGVEQRESIQSKGEKAPHLLVMTATPIPRSAAMTWFGDLDISWLTELPGGRKPIRTHVIPEQDSATMAQMFVHVRKRVDAGERAYMVCPRIDEDDQIEDLDPYGMADDSAASSGEGKASGAGGAKAPTAERPPLHSVEEMMGRLTSLPQFAGVEFASLTGRDDDKTKQQVMADFSSGRTPILVATTVIEVGVDVPQASCMVIFDADHYGLSQLHQLRGRVGRGGTNSWAFLVSRAEPGSVAEERLAVIEGTLDGAEIAQADLELRGAGDVLGDAQSGLKSSLKLLRVVQDADIIAKARSQAEELLAADPELKDHVELAGAVLDFTRGNESFIVSG
ncbi:ATP-dependent DNA helicase RecG [Bifidobacterium aemilianum]|uniref:ATP-dependent DNA helicase RecG n=1 Tax=Bifidobacterium aemilianum TaxID=2493120 RepID=A0A366K880_9BIFI|nr:ATP-dependent DNA helicase RecG [Bifidobacterium aemilianum]RBP97950.1 ATP-dependent DNA helicase RecG [Bifidobacterium aemilianum]